VPAIEPLFELLYVCPGGRQKSIGLLSEPEGKKERVAKARPGALKKKILFESLNSIPDCRENYF